jgi:hypothetical protein
MQRNRQVLGVLTAVFLICATLTLPNTSKLALAIGAMSTDYSGQKAALLNVKTVASSSEGKGSPTTTGTTTSAPRVGTIPKVILYWGTNNANSETLNARYVEYPSVFADSDSSSSTTPTLINKNPNFAFTVNSWPTINRGDIITAILDSSTNRATSRDLRIQLINVLNPSQAANYNSVRLGSTSIILSPAINGQNNKFVVPNSISGGYYLVNVFTKFQDKEFNAVYTGKLYIPYLQNKVTVSRTTTNTIIERICPTGTEKVGAECLKICEKGQERVDGQCVPKCNENEERVDGQCVPKCNENEERVDGQCVPKCNENEERVDGQCVPKCQSDEERDSNGQCVPHQCPTGQGRDPNTGQCVPTPEQDGSVRQPDCNDPANKGLAACNGGAGTDTGTGTIVPPDQGGSSSSSGGGGQGTDQGGSTGDQGGSSSDHKSKDSHKAND